MTAAWWWIDRWRKSTAYTDMSAEEQGLYRNLLDEVWLRETHVIPDDPRILAKVSGDPEAWLRCRDKVLSWMTKVDTGWTHETAREIIHQSQRRADKQATYRQRLATNHGNSIGNKAGNGAGNNHGSPSPSPSPSPSLKNPTKIQNHPKSMNPPEAVAPKNGANGNGNGRSRRPIFQGQRFVVFDWQLEDLARLLGPHTDGFDLHSWFFDLDAKAVKTAQVVPQRDGGKWLQSEALAEASRRGLTIATAAEIPQQSKRISGLIAGGEAFLRRNQS